MTPCSPNPCQNGGTCFKNGYAFVCACQPVWTGSRCEYSQTITVPTTSMTPSGMLFVLFIYKSFDNFSPRTQKYFIFFCFNYKLKTVIFYKIFIVGITCANQPCKNGGTCYNINNSYYCQCANVYTGINCETIPAISERIFRYKYVKKLFSFIDCPLNCAPGYCVPSGGTVIPYVCICDGTMKLTSCTSK